MVDGLTAIATSPNAEKAGYFLLAMALIIVIDRRLSSMVQSISTLITLVSQHATHNTARMTEIRNAFYTMRGWPVPDDEPTPGDERGGRHGQEGNVHKPRQRPIRQRGSGQ